MSGLFGGGSSQSGTTTTIQNSDPWSGQQPYLTQGFARAQSDILDKPMQFFPNSTVVPFAPQTERALSGAEARATAGSPLTLAGQNSMLATARGDFLDAGNPYMQQAFNAAARPVIESFQTEVMPGIDAAFSRAGRYGSGMQARANTQAADTLARNLTDLSGRMAFQNYDTERGRQMQASALAPQMAAADYADLRELERVGATREAQAGAELQDQINRFNFNQQEPRDRIAQYMALVGGGSFGGSSTATQPIYRNSTAEGLGAAATLAGIGGTLFGGNGIFPGLLGG